MTVSVDPLASAMTVQDDGRDTLIADEGGTWIAEVIGTTGNGGGGMAHGASDGRHSTNKRRVDALRRSCSRMTVGRYTASKVMSCHMEVWKLSPGTENVSQIR